MTTRTYTREPVRVGDIIESAAARSDRIEAEIRTEWDALAELLDEGTVSEGQFAWLIRHEPDEAAHPMVRQMWLGRLRRAHAAPGNISVDLEWGKTYGCPTCLDLELVFDDAGNAKPCPKCRARSYDLWAQHWSKPGHRCAECSGPRRGAAPPSRREEGEAEAEAYRQSVIDGL